MFNIGAPELMVIAVIALIILGPEKFPTQAKVFLRMIRELREHWDDAKRDIMKELNPVKSEFRDLRRFKPEELLDRLTGESDESTNESSKAGDTGNSPESAGMDSTPSTGSNEGAVAFESDLSEPSNQSDKSDMSDVSEGRSESTQWERKDDAPAAALTEADEYQAAAADPVGRPADGSD